MFGYWAAFMVGFLSGILLVAIFRGNSDGGI